MTSKTRSYINYVHTFEVITLLTNKYVYLNGFSYNVANISEAFFLHVFTLESCYTLIKRYYANLSTRLTKIWKGFTNSINRKVFTINGFITQICRGISFYITCRAFYYQIISFFFFKHLSVSCVDR